MEILGSDGQLLLIDLGLGAHTHTHTGCDVILTSSRHGPASRLLRAEDGIDEEDRLSFLLGTSVRGS